MFGEDGIPKSVIAKQKIQEGVQGSVAHAQSSRFKAITSKLENNISKLERVEAKEMVVVNKLMTT